MTYIVVTDKYRAEMGEAKGDALERLLNYPIGADRIMCVRERNGRPAEIETFKRHMFPLLVIHDRDLIERAKTAAALGERVLIETKFPKGHGDEYVTKIDRV